MANELSQRLIGLFLDNVTGRRPIYGGTEIFQTNSHWHDLMLFYEYFQGNDGVEIGASHQTGWTGFVAKLIQQCTEHGNSCG